MRLFSRRKILSSAGAIPVASAVITATAIIDQSTAAPSPVESPELLAIGEKIDPLLVELRRAVQHFHECYSLAESLLPELPSELVQPGRSHMEIHIFGEPERDVSGHEVRSRAADGFGYDQPRSVISSKEIAGAFRRGNLVRKSKCGQQMAKLMKLAKNYEAGRLNAIEKSNIESAKIAIKDAANAIIKLGGEFNDIYPRTHEGLIIFARMIEAYAEATTGDGLYPINHDMHAVAMIGQNLPRSILRIAASSNAA